jgi:hypothetical protein
MTGAEIAETLAMPIKTVQGILTRIALGKLWRLDQEQTVRYERQRPGKLIHVDVKKLGRIEGTPGNGSQAPQPDHPGAPGRRARTRSGGSSATSRSTTTRGLPSSNCWRQKATIAVGFLRRALTLFARHGIVVERVLTDGYFSLSVLVLSVKALFGGGAGVVGGAGGLRADAQPCCA